MRAILGRTSHRFIQGPSAQSSQSRNKLFDRNRNSLLSDSSAQPLKFLSKSLSRSITEAKAKIAKFESAVIK